MNNEAIKDRIRKLMKLANDGEASDGEIENAMRMAAALIDKHRIDPDELQRSEQDEADMRMGRIKARTKSSKFHQWEGILAHAVCELFGCVKHYLTHEKEPVRVNGVVQFHTGRYSHKMKTCRVVQFYGPLAEAQEAAELYEEWNHLIASMGVIRWGGAYRGDGEAYCQGFADQLLLVAQELNAGRRLVQTAAPKLLEGETKALAVISGRKDITLHERNIVLRERAALWLEEVEGVKLSRGQGRTGAASGSGEAYKEGREHGREAGFGRGRQQRRLN